MRTVDIEYKGVKLSVEGTYIEGSEGVFYNSDMSGSPYIPDDFDVNAVFAGDVNIYDLFSNEDLKSIEELVLEEIRSF